MGRLGKSYISFIRSKQADRCTAAVQFFFVLVLGSPLANMLLKPMRGDQEEEGDDTGEGKKASGAKNDITRSKERIDSEQVAKAAIDRAQNALELRRFLDERKTDWDRMEDMKRKLDAEMQDLDEDLQAREESLAKRRNGGK